MHGRRNTAFERGRSMLGGFTVGQRAMLVASAGLGVWALLAAAPVASIA